MRRLVLGSLATALSLSLAGCGGDTPDPTPGGTAATSASDSASASASPATEPSAPASADPTEVTQTPEPTEPLEPAVAPATGPVLSGPTFSLNVPADFNPEGQTDPRGGTIGAPDPRYNVTLTNYETTTGDGPLDDQVELSQQSGLTDPPLKRQPDVTIAGQPAYHLAGKDSSFPTWADEYGFHYQGHLVTFTISTPRRLPVAERAALNASILASATLLQ